MGTGLFIHLLTEIKKFIQFYYWIKNLSFSNFVAEIPFLFL